MEHGFWKIGIYKISDRPARQPWVGLQLEPETEAIGKLDGTLFRIVHARIFYTSFASESRVMSLGERTFLIAAFDSLSSIVIA